MGEKEKNKKEKEGRRLHIEATLTAHLREKKPGSTEKGRTKKEKRDQPMPASRMFFIRRRQKRGKREEGEDPALNGITINLSRSHWRAGEGECGKKRRKEKEGKEGESGRLEPGVGDSFKHVCVDEGIGLVGKPGKKKKKGASPR